jgi:hypothetical protein
MLFTLLQEFVSANSARAAYDDQKHAVLVTHLNEVLESSKTEQKRMNELEIVLKRFTEGFETHLKTLGDMAAETKGDVGCISKKLDAMHYYKQVKNSVRPPARPAAAQQNTNPLRTTRPPVSWSQFQDQYASLQANMQRYLSFAQSLCHFAKIQCSVLDGRIRCRRDPKTTMKSCNERD